MISDYRDSPNCDFAFTSSVNPSPTSIDRVFSQEEKIEENNETGFKSLGSLFSSVTLQASSPLPVHPAKFSCVISLNPPKPNNKLINDLLGDKSIFEENVQEWINVHHSYYQPALRELADKVTRVTHKQFTQQLEEAVDRFNQALDVAQDKKYVILIQPGKSNQWVAELAYPHLRYLPHDFQSLGEKQARDYVTYLDRLRAIDEVAKTIVLFDDASYSGTQLKEHVEAIFNKQREMGLRGSSIYVVVPYATNYALKTIETVKKCHDQCLHIICKQRIPSVGEDLLEESVKRLKELYGWSDEDKEIFGRGLNYFHHKLPNGMSFVEPFSKGSVRMGVGDHQLAQPVKKLYKNLPIIESPYK